MLCTKSHIYVAMVTKKHTCVVKYCWILSLGATSCQCPIHTDLSRWFQAYNVRNAGISGIIFSWLQATLTTLFCNHEVTQWHLRTEATHDHTVHEFPVSLHVSNKYYVFIFWSWLWLSRLTTHIASITWKLTSMSTVMLYPTTANLFSEVRHAIWRLR